MPFSDTKQKLYQYFPDFTSINIQTQMILHLSDDHSILITFSVSLREGLLFFVIIEIQKLK